jgi:hypothetical protein
MRWATAPAKMAPSTTRKIPRVTVPTVRRAVS